MSIRNGSSLNLWKSLSIKRPRVILALFIGAFLMLSGGVASDVNRNVLSQESDVSEWWAVLSDGGVFRISTQKNIIEVPMVVSTSYARNDTDVLVPIIDDHPPGEPVEKVLRGTSGDTSAAVVLAEDKVAAIINNPDIGSHRVNIPPIESDDPGDHPPVPDPPSGFADDHQGSIRLSKFAWTTSSPSPNVPLNAVFYDIATEDWVDHVLKEEGWTPRCGSSKQAHLSDARHGGSDSWRTQNEDYADPDKCAGDRNHIRTFASNVGDTHTPGFTWYNGIDIHWETGLTHSNVYPQEGQDTLLLQLSSSQFVDNIWLRSVGTTSSECTWCNNWGGWIDLYQLPSLSDPCNDSSGPNFSESGTTVKTITWTCPS